MWNYELKSKDTCCCRMSSVSSHTRRGNFYECLELLQNTNDIHILATIFSTLGIYILSKNVADEIIKCEAIYEKISYVLNCGLQSKTTIVLNFISALLHHDESGPTRKRTLFIYTQNMLRNSGCLTAMSNLLASFMLHQETLKALCLSISEAVRDSPANQTLCSHLVPLCIQKCRRGCWETCSVLQSLLNKHNRNVKFFHECNGMTIFTRESMLNTQCLQLINTVLENTKPEDRQNILNTSHIFEYLLQHLQKYGRSTPIGQWASIILYSYQKVLDVNLNVKSLLENRTGDRQEHKTYVMPMQTKTKKSSTSNKLSETNELFQNILNEIILSQRQGTFQKDKGNPVKCTSNIKFLQEPIGNMSNIQFLKDPTGNMHISKIRQNAPQDYDLSFSFLLEDTSQNRNINIPVNKSKYESQSIFKNQVFVENKKNLNAYNMLSKQNVTQSSVKTFNKNKTFLRRKERSIVDFEPRFVSTPKKTSIDQLSRSQVSILTATRTTSRINNLSKIHKTNNRIRKVHKTKQKTLQNKTMTAKFFNIVNASCTTIIKSFNTFKNIFKSKKALEASERNDNDSFGEVNTSCSYSFTNYMRERDAILMKNNKGTSEDESITSFQTVAKDCNTCNDTIALKQKLANNVSLQKTIKKLKMGINLYGCDFKKISRNMWPRENYMTPSVLYNLYRKLIIK